MTLLQASRTVMRRAMPRPSAPGQAVPRRGMATHEPEVSWAEYRSGEKTLAQWVEANRHVVAGSMFFFYVGLAIYKLRPGRGSKSAPEAEGAAPPGDAPVGAGSS